MLSGKCHCTVDLKTSAVNIKTLTLILPIVLTHSMQTDITVYNR